MPSPRHRHYKKGIPGLPKRARELAEKMAEGASWTDAAMTMSIARSTARIYRQLPAFKTYYLHCLAELRDGERGRNLKTLVEIRDSPKLIDAGAAAARARIEAVRTLEGEHGGVTVNVGVGVGINATVTPGFIVDVSQHHAAAERLLSLARSTRSLDQDGRDSVDRVIEHDGAGATPTPQPSPVASVRPGEPGFGRRPFEEFPPRDSRRRLANDNADAVES